jgi:ATP-dependent DNA helicase RecG
MDASTAVQFLPGVGPRRAQLLGKLGIVTTRDLLWHLPRAWIDRSRITPLARLIPGAGQTAVAVIRRAAIARLRGGMSLFRADLEDSSGRAGAVWFHQPYLAQKLLPGQLVVLSGAVRLQEDRAQFIHPEYEILVRQGDAALTGGRIVPVYPLTAGLSQKMLRGMVWTALEQLGPKVGDPLPPSLRARTGLCELARALSQVHFPETMEEAERARDRLAFDELFTLQLALALARRRRESRQSAYPLDGPGALQQGLRSRLPFRLTGGQESVLGEVLQDLRRERPMYRLLQGDVGSGKTVVAALACLAAVEAGAQAAYLAPTEILASQQAGLFDDWFTPLGLTPALLLGRTPAGERRRLLAALRSGGIHVIVGTHALLEEGVDFARLGLVVVDEQHRFGVLQRRGLAAKGEALEGGRERTPHCLVMSATPIPRTLGLTIYADLDLSLLKEMPAGRVPPRTRVVEEAQREKMLAWIAERLRGGGRGFFVYPLVEESEQLDLRDAIGAAETLRAHPAMRGLGVGLLHGRMKGAEKERAVAAFREGKTPALVTTTVVEVGVDVPQATVMVVEHPERFGLSQLHQLRGRVGRGGGESHVFLMKPRRMEEISERLQVLVRHADGFSVAEEDYRLRGPGEILGTAQHGLPRFRVADLARDRELPALARSEAARILSEDSELQLPIHRPLRAHVQFFYGERMPLFRVG